ncbi:MAG: monofunctional biosynthetic peptidoglycan transglycosylase [Candidatus Hydrogenedentota bacterium]
MKLRQKSLFARLVLEFVQASLAFIILLVCTPVALILPLSRLDPPTTSLQTQRRFESWIDLRAYDKDMRWVPLREISPRLRRAVIVAEDGWFYRHPGVDIEAAEKAYEESRNGKKMRGASTITMQLCKNLYLWEGWTIYDTAFRKGVEVYLALWMNQLLSKERVLELYLNVIEWGDGIYGAEAAAQRYYRVAARNVSASQAAHLVASLPAPIRHTPIDQSLFVERRAARILGRM